MSPARLRLVARTTVAVVIVLSFGVAGAVLAAEPVSPRPRVLVFSPPSGEPLAARLLAELYAVGIDGQLVPLTEDAPAGAPGDVSAGADASDRRAIIRVSSGGTGTEVWAADSRGRGLLRQSLTSSSQAMAAVVALRTMELLRATLLPEPEPAPPRPAAPRSDTPPLSRSQLARPVPDGSAPVSPSSTVPALRLACGPSVLLSGGGTGAMPAATLSALVKVRGDFGLEGMILAAAWAARIGSVEGTSRFWLAMLGAGPAAGASLGSHVRVDLGLGALLIVVRASGEPVSPYLASSETDTMAAGYLRLGGGVRATTRISVRADLLTGLSTRRIVIRAGALDVARWGRGFAAATVALQLDW